MAAPLKCTLGSSDFGLKRTTKLAALVLLCIARVGRGADAFAGVVGGTSDYWKLEDTVPSARAFNDAFRRIHGGRVPTDYGALGYAGATTVLAAVRAAGTTETERVADVLAALRYDAYKGPQYHRACDHQSVQSMLIIGSKDKPGAGDADLFEMLAQDGPDEAMLRGYTALGHS